MEYKLLNQTDFSLRSWRKFDNFRFAETSHWCPIVIKELARVCVELPIAFIEREGGYTAIAITGLVSGSNVFVDSAGRWVGRYVPAHYRTHPFKFLEMPDGSKALGVQVDSDVVIEGLSALPFFQDDGQLSDDLQPVVDMLRKLEDNRAATTVASQALSDAGVLEPWDVTPVVNGEKRKLGGLYYVSQQALNSIDAETLADLRDKGALAMAYCQQISQQLIQRLEMLHERRAKEQVKRSNHPADQGSFGLGFDEGEGGISFGGMADNDD